MGSSINNMRKIIVIILSFILIFLLLFLIFGYLFSLDCFKIVNYSDKDIDSLVLNAWQFENKYGPIRAGENKKICFEPVGETVGNRKVSIYSLGKDTTIKLKPGKVTIVIKPNGNFEIND